MFKTTSVYILGVGYYYLPVLKMKLAGLSKFFRMFVYHMQRKRKVMHIQFYCDAGPVDGEVTFDW